MSVAKKWSSTARTFKELVVWQRAHAFVLRIYLLTSGFPKHELYGLTSQFRRAAVSIPANIAEGFRKQSATDKARYMNTAEGSLEECRYYILLSHDLGYSDQDDLWELSEEVARLLHAYRRAILSASPSIPDESAQVASKT